MRNAQPGEFICPSLPDAILNVSIVPESMIARMKTGPELLPK
jgi:hypothetical protein